MGEQDPDRNSVQHNGVVIHRFISSNEGRLTFCDSYEGNLVPNQNSRIHPDGTVQSIENLVTV